MGTTENFLFVGRSQTGKSTLVNSLLGVSDGTKKPSTERGSIHRRHHSNTRYGESPDLAVADAVERANAAKTIETFLRECKHNCKLVFVCTLESGRVHPDDVTTIKVVLDAINDDTFPYSIVVNKTSARLKCDSDYSDRLLSIMSCGHKNPAEIFFYPYDEQLADADNVIVKPNDDFRNFMQRQKAGVISQSRIIKLDDSKFTSFKHLHSK
jgi:GTP-binding protein EngB required for normal cell division